MVQEVILIIIVDPTDERLQRRLGTQRGKGMDRKGFLADVDDGREAGIQFFE
jgi:hypothetical protein